MRKLAFGGVALAALVGSVGASAATKPAVVPAVGKACAAKNVGSPVVGANKVLLDCVKSGKSYRWQVSKLNVPTTTAAPVVAGAATTAPATTAAVAQLAKSDKWPDKIVFAPVPSENATAALVTWAPFIKGLEKELGIKVDQVNPSDYAGVIEAQLSGKVDLAMYGPFSYYLAKQAGAKVAPVSVLVANIGLPATYQSYLITKADNTSINKIEDVRGKKVCFVDTASTSGYLYPYAGLKEAGIDLNKDITPVFAGGHDRSVAAVAAGTCDAGFAFDDMVNITAPERGLIKKGDIKIVWRSKGIPQSPIAVRTDLPDSLVKKIMEVVPKIDSLYFQANRLCPDGSANCSMSGGNAWVPVDDSFFQPIADVCKATNAPACQPAKK